MPQVSPFRVASNGLPSKKPLVGLVRDNPNAPLVHAGNKGVHQAVVFLRGADPATARPWHHAPVLVEQRDFRLHVKQGDRLVRTGIVRCGSDLAMLSGDPLFHSVHAQGAAFFSYPFVERERKTTHRLNRPGLIELSSGAGFYWMRAYLFVADHPYYACTDQDGHFRLDQVPAGRYQLVCWHPNWRIARHERDPEASVVSRVFFAPPLEEEKDLLVRRGESTRVAFTMRATPAIQDASWPEPSPMTQ